MNQIDNEKNDFSLKNFLKEYFDLHKDKDNELKSVDSIRKGVEFKGANLWILVFAVFICSLGLNVNSTAVIIGAMLISPLMGPIMGLGLAAGINDFELMKRSFKSFFVATIFSIIASTLFFLISPVAEGQSELLARTSPTIYDVFIALLGGMGAFIALSTKEKGNVIPGAAIATALMPPLCTAGYGLATGNLIYFMGALYLYFINTVFISISTYVGVRALRFQRKEFVNKQREKTVQKYIFLIALSTMLPAGYLTIEIIQESIQESNINKFVANELNFSQTQILDKKLMVEDGQKELRIVLIGKEVSKDAINQARKKMADYKLKDIRLLVLQGMNDGYDMSSLRAMVMEDFYHNSEKRLEDQSKKIESLETEISKYQQYDRLGEEIIPELKILYPSIRRFSIARGIEYGTDSTKVDTTAIAVLTLDRQLSSREKETLADWLKTRVKSNNIRLITN